MNDEHFGSCLRRAREERALTIGDVSASTKVPRSAIEMLESGALAGLPAHVFVRGFIRSYAKAVGITDAKPLGLFDRAVNAKTEAAIAEVSRPSSIRCSPAVSRRRTTTATVAAVSGWRCS